MMLGLISRNFDHKSPEVMEKTLYSFCETTSRTYDSILVTELNQRLKFTVKSTETSDKTHFYIS